MSRLSDDVSVLAEAATLLTTPLNLPAAIAGASVTDPAGATASNPSVPAALTQDAVTDALDGATFSGTTLTTASTPTVDELEACVGSLALALNQARTDNIAMRAEIITYEVAISALIVDVADVRTQLSALLTSLEAAGLIAT